VSEEVSWGSWIY